MTYSHITREIRQMLLSSDNLGAETVALPGVYLASLSARCNSTGILSPVLEDWKPVVDVLDGRSSGVGEDDGDDSTHFRDSLPPSQTKQDQQTVDFGEDSLEERGVKVMLAHCFGLRERERGGEGEGEGGGGRGGRGERERGRDEDEDEKEDEDEDQKEDEEEEGEEGGGGRRGGGRGGR